MCSGGNLYVAARGSVTPHNAMKCATSGHTGVGVAPILCHWELPVDAWPELRRVSVIRQPDDRQRDTGTGETRAGLHQLRD